MSPDQAHSAYYAANPTGNHSVPSPETLRMFEDHRRLIEENKSELNRVDEKIDAINDSKISYSHFYWVVGILLGVVSGMFYLVYNNQIEMSKVISNVSDKVYETKQAVVQMQGKLDPYKVEFR